jgi:hypothetical protein
MAGELSGEDRLAQALAGLDQVGTAVMQRLVAAATWRWTCLSNRRWPAPALVSHIVGSMRVEGGLVVSCAVVAHAVAGGGRFCVRHVVVAVPPSALPAARLESNYGVVSYNQVAGAKVKLDELFVQWLSIPQTGSLIMRMIEDAKGGRPLPIPTIPL